MPRVGMSNLDMLEFGAGERRAVVACSGEECMPVASPTRKLQQAVQRSGLDARSQLTALALAARDLLQENGEAGAGEMQEAKG